MLVAIVVISASAKVLEHLIVVATLSSEEVGVRLAERCYTIVAVAEGMRCAGVGAVTKYRGAEDVAEEGEVDGVRIG